MRRLVVRGVMGGVVWVGGGGHRCRVWGPVMGSLVAVAGGGIRGGMCRRGHRHRLAGAGCRVLCPWPGLGGGAGGGGVGVALLVVGGAGVGVVLAGGLGVPVGRVGLRVCAVWPLRFLTGCGAGVWVGGGRMSVRAGLWSVCNGWLPVDGARWYGVWVGGLLVVVGWGGRGWVLCRLGVRASLWVVWVLRVCAVWPLRFLTGRGAGVRVGGDRMSPRVGLWSVCDGWLLVDGARWYGVWVGGLLVVVGRPYSVLVLPVCVRGSSRVHGGVRWLVCRGPV